MAECDDPHCTCWVPEDLREPVEVCAGRVEVWDQTVGCPECNWQLWDWREWAGEVCFDEALRRFELAHPLQFEEGHDHGDEDEDHRTGDRHFHPELVFGGWRFPSFKPYWWGE